MNWSSENLQDKIVNFMEKASKYKIYLIIALIILLLLFCFLFSTPKEENVERNIEKYIELIGPNIVTIYKGETYKEFGFKAYDKENNSYENEVIVDSNLNTNISGEYKITYKLGKKEVIRKVIVLDTPKESYKMILESGDTIYLKINEEYIEPGYKILDQDGNEVTDKVKVKITGKVDKSKKGIYTLIYQYTDLNGKKINVKRDVVVVDNKLNIQVDKSEKTNTSVKINIKVDDELFDYILLPNGEKITEKEYSYLVEQNGIYKFILYNKKGFNIEKTVEIVNIDKENPAGTCTFAPANGKTVVNIKVQDNVGIKKYVIDNKQYSTNNITINKEMKNVSVDIYDKADNVTNVVCDAQSKNSRIKLTRSKTDYTNSNINIIVEVFSDYFEYLKLPNGKIVYNKNYTYKVESNGTYTFTLYDKNNQIKKETIVVNNIDKEAPTGECFIKKDNSGLFIEINANDNVGIKKYLYNNQEFTQKKLILNKVVTTAKIIIYDKANNKKEITCKNLAVPKIDSITKDGVIVKVKASKATSKIKGYYFSYTSQRLNKNQGGYVATNKETIDVVRLPGTTYVWVEDESGSISEAKTITITNDALINTSGGNYQILQKKTLSTFLKEKGWSVEELSKLMARSVRASKMYTGEAAATAAVSLQTVLAQKYKIVLPYQSAGIYSTVTGINPNWGGTSSYYGLDCSGFVSWTYTNAGFNFESRPYYWSGSWKRLELSKANGEIGDILVWGGKVQGERHVKLIIGKTNSGFIIAESSGNGMVIGIHPYVKEHSYDLDYKILKASNITNNNTKYSLSEYPSGF